jgi:hypothetical protein
MSEFGVVEAMTISLVLAPANRGTLVRLIGVEPISSWRR